MKHLTKLEQCTIGLSAIWFGDYAFPGHGSADFVSGYMTTLLTALIMAALVSWIKSGGDTHL